MTHYKCSDGTRISKEQIDINIRNAKAKKIKQFFDKHGYLVCQDCGRNDCVPIDCSHDVSVKFCQEEGMSELAWDIKNLKLRGRNCHRKFDGNGLSSAKL
jgi:hypothetical protein